MRPKRSKESPALIRGSSYRELISKIGLSIDEGRRLSARNVNSVLVVTYWSVGRWIVEFEQRGRDRAAYGEMLIERISQDLTKRYGKGWGENQLLDIRQFYLTYRGVEKPHTLCGELETSNIALQSASIPSPAFSLSWSHYRFLMRIEDSAKRQFYEAECRRGNWSVRQLDRQIQSLLFERTSLSRRKSDVISRANAENIIQRPEDAIKEPYVLDFLNLRDDYSESDLEDALIKHLENFLLELGEGFTFVARQKRFEIGSKQYRMDLVLYNRILRALFIIDLKIGDFEHGDAGQMNFYLNWVRDNERFPGENDPIGLILCSGKNQIYAKYVLGGMSNKIFVSKYQIRLPKVEDIQKELDETKKRLLTWGKVAFE